jgi:hypothetical protein
MLGLSLPTRGGRCPLPYLLSRPLPALTGPIVQRRIRLRGISFVLAGRGFGSLFPSGTIMFLMQLSPNRTIHRRRFSYRATFQRSADSRATILL